MEKDSKKSVTNNEGEEKIACKYGKDCYQKNPKHLAKYYHPGDLTVTPKKRRRSSVDEDSEEKTDEETDEEKLSPYSRWKREHKRNDHNSSSDIFGDLSDDENLPKTKSPDTKKKKLVRYLQTPKNYVKRQVFNSSSDMFDDSDEDQTSQVIIPTVQMTKKEEKRETFDEDEFDAKSNKYIQKKNLIGKFFRFDMPKDFYDFYKFCQSLSPKDPNFALKIVNLELVGPFDILNGKIRGDFDEDEKYLLHWRYYYDPPEFQTILKGSDKEGLHFGYWRDDPVEKPVFVAKNSALKDSKIIPVGPNIFAAVKVHIEEEVKRASLFEKSKITKFLQDFCAYAKKNKISVETNSPEMKLRERNVVSKTFHGAGIVVPFDKNTQVGYRNLIMSDSHLKKHLDKIKAAESDDDRRKMMGEIEETIRMATIAADESDFGTPLELAHDLFSSDIEFLNHTTLSMFQLAYGLLNRSDFASIAKNHLECRKKGCDLSVI